MINRVVHTDPENALFVHRFTLNGDKVIHSCGEIHAFRGISTALASVLTANRHNYTRVSYAQCG